MQSATIDTVQQVKILLRNIQPFFADTNAGGIGVAHNGNLTNSVHLEINLLRMELFFIQLLILKLLFN